MDASDKTGEVERQYILQYKKELSLAQIAKFKKKEKTPI